MHMQTQAGELLQHHDDHGLKGGIAATGPETCTTCTVKKRRLCVLLHAAQQPAGVLKLHASVTAVLLRLRRHTAAWRDCARTDTQVGLQLQRENEIIIIANACVTAG